MKTIGVPKVLFQVELNQHHTAVGAATQVDGLGLVTA
jgi:hypothetical protein